MKIRLFIIPGLVFLAFSLSTFAQSINLLERDAKLIKNILITVAKLNQPDNKVWDSYQFKDKLIQVNRKGSYDCIIGLDKPIKNYQLILEESGLKLFCRKGGSDIESSFNFIEINGVPTLLVQLNNLDNTIRIFEYNREHYPNFPRLDPYVDTLLFILHEAFHLHQQSLDKFLYREVHFSEYMDIDNITLALVELELLKSYFKSEATIDQTLLDFIAIRSVREQKSPTFVGHDLYLESAEGTAKFIELNIMREYIQDPQEIKSYKERMILQASRNNYLDRIRRGKSYFMGMVLSELASKTLVGVPDLLFSKSPYNVLKETVSYDINTLEVRAQEIMQSKLYMSLKEKAQEIIKEYKESLSIIDPLFDANKFKIVLPLFEAFAAYESISLPTNDLAAYFSYYRDYGDSFIVNLSNESQIGVKLSRILSPEYRNIFSQSLSEEAMVKVDSKEAISIKELSTTSFNRSLQILSEEFDLSVQGSGKLELLPGKTFILIPEKGELSTQMEKMKADLTSDPNAYLRKLIVTWE